MIEFAKFCYSKLDFENMNIFFGIMFFIYVKWTSAYILENTNKNDLRMDMIADILKQSFNSNGWHNVFVMGNFTDGFHKTVRDLPTTVTITETRGHDYEFKSAVVPYPSNIIVINCKNFGELEDIIMKIIVSPYWHPHSRIILYYRHLDSRENLAKIFFILWYYKAVNAIIVQYNDASETLLISNYNPYMNDHSQLNLFGCWTTKKVGIPLDGFEKGFRCTSGCRNVTLLSKFRALHLGTCLGIETYHVLYNDSSPMKTFDVFLDKGKDLHGYTLRAYAVEVMPFLEIKEENGTYSLHSRDGMIWNTIAKLMNFSIDLSPGKKFMKSQFDFEINIQQVYAFTQRKADLVLFPVYLFDLIIVQPDNTIAYEESGVCILSQRAGFETIVFDEKLIRNNIDMILMYLLCLVCTWFTFFVFHAEQIRTFSLDQAGKDMVNTVRAVLSISLCKPPKRGSFRIFLTIAIWSFFVINFTTQAAIISLFSVYKRGKDVDTFDDVIEKDYIIEGMASPDVVLPENEEQFRKINSKFVPIQDIFGCIKNMKNDSNRFCLIDCAVGRYLERNMLNEKGEQYFHIATEDRIHTHYLNMIQHKHSPLTEQFNKYMLAFVEAGLITKWEEYRYNNIKEDAPIKALGMDDLGGIFKCYFLLVGASSVVFVLELSIAVIRRLKVVCGSKFRKHRLKNVSLVKNTFNKKAKRVDISTQTIE